MPRAIITPARAAQIKAWRLAGTAASAAKRRGKRKTGVPQGKNVIMVHYTSKERARNILKEQKFRPHPHQANVGHVFATPWRNRRNPDFRGKFGYGYSGVQVRVPRKALKRDADWPHPQSYMFPASSVKGRKISRVSGIRVRKKIR